MHVAMIGQKGVPARSGGVERYVEELCRRLAARGIPTTVYSRHWYVGNSPTAQLPRSVRQVVTPSLRTKHLDTITHVWFAVNDVLARDYIDLIHVHCPGPALLLPLLRLARKPIVWTIHGLDWKREKWGRIARWVLQAGEWCGARLADRVVVVSPALVEYVRARYGREAVCVPNAASALPYRPPSFILRFGIEPRRYLLCVGRLVPEKGIHLAIEAYRALRRDDVQLVIAGGSMYDDAYERRLRAQAGTGVIFTGPADRELLAELYHHALVFLLPSTLEGMSIALLEALHHGLACVVSDIPENTAVVDHPLGVFRSGDAASLAGRLAHLLDRPERLAELRAYCRRRAGRFSWDEVVERMVVVYRDALAASRGRAKAFLRRVAEDRPRSLARGPVATV